MDNNEVYALFEDIKGGLKSINNKLNTPNNSQSDGQLPAMDLTSIKDLFNSLSKEHLEQNKTMLIQYTEAHANTSDRILNLLCDLKECSDERKNKPQEHIHRHSFDIRSNKVLSLLVGIGIAFTFSVWGNIELWQSKCQYADDALKFRAIRSWGGCSAKDILWLNDVFDIHRDEEAIKWVRGQADGYAASLKAVSDSLMQESLKARQMNNDNKK